MAVSLALFSGLSRLSSVPAGSLANASSVGANTVNGPLPFSVSTRPAACSAAARVLNDPAATAVSTMSAVAASALTDVPNEDVASRAIERTDPQSLGNELHLLLSFVSRANSTLSECVTRYL